MTDPLAQEKTKNKIFVYIDCETMNLALTHYYNLPWEIGMLKVKSDEIIDTRDFYVKWPNSHLKISSEASAITKYSPKKMELEGKEIQEVYPEIENWLDDADYIITHNGLGFDLYLLKDLYNNIGKKCYKHILPKMIDSNSLSKALLMEIQYKKQEMSLLQFQYRMNGIIKKGVKTNLTAMGHYFKIEHAYDKLHNAIVDLELNKKVFERLRSKFDLF